MVLSVIVPERGSVNVLIPDGSIGECTLSIFYSVTTRAGAACVSAYLISRIRGPVRITNTAAIEAGINRVDTGIRVLPVHTDRWPASGCGWLTKHQVWAPSAKLTNIILH